MFDSSKIQPHIAFTDLREWMAEAEKLGELKTVLGASWQEDIGLATDVVVPPDDGPAVIFDEVPGCPKGFRVIINCFAGKRRAMTFGFPQGSDQARVERRVLRALSNQRQASRAGIRRQRAGVREHRSKATISTSKISDADLASSTTAAATSAPAVFP